MENLDVGEFNPKKEELTKMVLASSKIIVSDLRDLKQIEAVKESRLSLRKVEIQIEKDGKGYREKAREIINYVLDKEKEFKKITSPEIERLKGIEEKSEAILLKDKRLKMLPDRKERLEAIEDSIKVEDDYLLGLDDLEFVTYFNQRVANKNEADKIAEEDRAEKARAEAQEKLDKDKEALRIKEQEAQAKIDKANEDLAQKNKEAQDKIDEANRKIKADKLDLQHKKELQEADERAKKELEEEQEADRLKAIKDKKEEDEKLKKRTAYIEFLEENGYTEKTKDEYTIIKSEDKIVLYKKVGEFEL